jgi:ankyrin repeat protein
MSILIAAIQAKNITMTRLLLDAATNLHIKDAEGNTAIEYAVALNDKIILQILEQRQMPNHTKSDT